MADILHEQEFDLCCCRCDHGLICYCLVSWPFILERAVPWAQWPGHV